MKIIADTHIYYELGQNKELFEKVKYEPISPTFINILELSKTHNLVNKPDYVRDAIRSLFNFKNEVIYEPPFVHLAQLYAEYYYDPVSEFGDFLRFTSRIAEGDTVAPDKTAEFIEWAEKIKLGFIEGANFTNDTATKIKEEITSKKEHREKKTLQLTMNFINHFVIANTKGSCNLEEIDLSASELLIKTLDIFFKTMETSSMKMQPNDWFDFAILSYLQPGDKFWTKEKKWKTLIRECGCESYLIDF
ncbi:MAG: hypothetical protein JWM28_1595 [Chitinophagaceae bacterium]|nr:hypothetical protein [Chitinophagaceae bacterium]